MDQNNTVNEILTVIIIVLIIVVSRETHTRKIENALNALNEKVNTDNRNKIYSFYIQHTFYLYFEKKQE